MIPAITGAPRLSELLFNPRRTCPTRAKMSPFDPKGTSSDGADHKICIGLHIGVNRPGAMCSDAVKVDSW
jgi:hypothetical protein